MDQKPVMKAIVTPPVVDEKHFWTVTAVFHFFYSLVGLMAGLACIIGGIMLFFNGITGSTSWTAKFLGLESSISDAAPGAILFIVGLFIAWITRFNVEAGTNK